MKDGYPGCDICSFEPDKAMVLHGNEFWQANLRDDDQTLLATTIITAKRHVPEVDYLTPAEESAFVDIRNLVYGAIRRTFQPQTFNLSCLKNNAFTSTDTPPEAGHVHYHLKPRYGGPTIFAGHQFTDPMPGRYLASFDRVQPDRTVALAIADAIRAAMP